MITPEDDQRSAASRARDEEIAREPELPPVALPPDAIPSPIETHLGGQAPPNRGQEIRVLSDGQAREGKTVKTSFAFDSLVGLTPGVSKVGEAMARFGTASVSECSNNGWYYNFGGQGVFIVVDELNRDAADPVVDEVFLAPPFRYELPCGVHLGQQKEDAIAIVRRHYTVTAEYEDSIYFLPTARNDLLASVEFWDQPIVVGIELMLAEDALNP